MSANDSRVVDSWVASRRAGVALGTRIAGGSWIGEALAGPRRPSPRRW